MTDVSPQSAPAGDSLPQRGGPLPQRGGRQQHGEPLSSFPQRAESLPQGGQYGDAIPRREGSFSQYGDSLPQRNSALPQYGDSQYSDSLPQRNSALPQYGDSQYSDSLPQRSSALPQRGDSLPQRNSSLPQRGDPTGAADPLPRRTSRTRPAGRHRSPHRLSVASDAPSLIIAVPGSAEADTTRIGEDVAAIASMSCPGVDIRVGYLDGETLPVSDCLDLDGTGRSGESDFPSVIVPLLLSPSPQIDLAMKRLAAQPTVSPLLAAHLGPHPLVAEALHARLAEAGLARHARATGLSISADGRGVVVLADVGEEATNAAAVAAVLLASRLSVPVVPASLGDPASIADAVTRLSESGAPRPVLAPCWIGPEINPTVLADLSAALGAPAAAPLGAHQAVGQLVAIRYGAALAGLSLAG